MCSWTGKREILKSTSYSSGWGVNKKLRSLVSSYVQIKIMYTQIKSTREAIYGLWVCIRVELPITMNIGELKSWCQHTLSAKFDLCGRWFSHNSVEDFCLKKKNNCLHDLTIKEMKSLMGSCGNSLHTNYSIFFIIKNGPRPYKKTKKTKKRDRALFQTLMMLD